MKKVHAVDPQLSEMETSFLAQAQRVFHDYPELLSFSLEEEIDPCEPLFLVDPDAERFDLHVGLVAEVSDDFQKELCEAVSQLIAQTLHDHPETLEVLRGRTFARALH